MSGTAALSFCNVFHLSFSFKQFANVSLSNWSLKTEKPASQAIGVQGDGLKNKMPVNVARKEQLSIVSRLPALI